MEQLILTDQQWLLAINGAHAVWADWLMWYVSQSWVWIPLYMALIALMWYRFGWKFTLIALLCLAAAVGLSDWISSGVIKHAVCRLRPTHEPALEGLVHTVFGYRGGQYGFVSSHAANTIAVALLYSLMWEYGCKHTCRTRSHACWWLLVYVAANCYSRMYLGVHYLGDILGGLLVGGTMSAIVFALFRYWVAPCLLGDVSDADRDWYAAS